MARISVVIPLHNRERYIKRTLDSVLRQTCQDFEVIVVNDGSIDRSAAKVREINDRRIRLINQCHAGVAAARNRGIKEAGTELIALAAAGVVWRPEFLETMLRLNKLFPAAGVYAAGYEAGQDGGRLARPRFAGIPAHPWEGLVDRYFRVSCGAELISLAAVAVPRRVFATVGGFATGLRSGEDREMWARIALRFPVTYSTAIGGTYYRHDDDGGGRRAPVEEHLFIRKLKEVINSPGCSPQLAADIKAYIAGSQLRRAGQCTRFGRPDAARGVLRESYRLGGFSWRWLGWYILSFCPSSVGRLLSGARLKVEVNGLWPVMGIAGQRLRV